LLIASAVPDQIACTKGNGSWGEMEHTGAISNGSGIGIGENAQYPDNKRVSPDNLKR